MGLCGCSGDTIEEFPLIWSKETWEDTLDKVKTVGESISFEEGTANFSVRESDETVRQLLEFLFNACSLWFGLQSLVKQLNEG